MYIQTQIVLKITTQINKLSVKFSQIQLQAFSPLHNISPVPCNHRSSFFEAGVGEEISTGAVKIPVDGIYRENFLDCFAVRFFSLSDIKFRTKTIGVNFSPFKIDFLGHSSRVQSRGVLPPHHCDPQWRILVFSFSNLVYSLNLQLANC